MTNGAGAGPPSDVQVPSSPPGTWTKHGRWGSIFRSYDFKLSLPFAIAIGALPALVETVASNAVPLLIAFGGALAAIAGLVIVAITVFVGVITPEYLVIMEQLRGGVQAAVRPYYIVVSVSMIGVLASFAAALAWPAIPAHASWLRWLAFSVPALFTCWGLLGAIQLVALGNFHIEQRARLAELVREMRSVRRSDTK